MEKDRQRNLNSLQKSNISLVNVKTQIKITNKIISTSTIEKKQNLWKEKLNSLYNQINWGDDRITERRKWSVLLEESKLCVNEFPQWAYGYLYRGKSQEELDNIRGAISDFDEAIKLKYKDAIAYYWRASCNSKLDKYDEANKDRIVALDLESDFAEAYFFRGHSRKRANDLEGALVEYSKAIEMKSNYWNWAFYFNRARTKKELNDLYGAFEDYSSAINLTNYDFIFFERGNIYFSIKDYKKAISDYNRAIELHKDIGEYIDAYKMRGKARANIGDHKGSKEDIKKVDKLERKQKK